MGPMPHPAESCQAGYNNIMPLSSIHSHHASCFCCKTSVKCNNSYLLSRGGSI